MLDDWGAATEESMDQGADQALDLPRALALLAHVIAALARQRYAALEELLDAYEIWPLDLIAGQH